MRAQLARGAVEGVLCERQGRPAAYAFLLRAPEAKSLLLLLYAVDQFHLPAFAAEMWARLRFPVAAVAGYFALFFLYALAQDGRQPWRNIWPGTLAALGAWLLISWGYAVYVNDFANYSVLYGSIGTVIVLLIWLNLTALVLIMGAELNGTLISLRKDSGEMALEDI